MNTRMQTLLLASLLAASVFARAAIVPAPATMKAAPGIFALAADTKVFHSHDEAAKAEAETLAGALRPATGFAFQVLPTPGDSAGGYIRVATDPSLAPALGDEGYVLEVSERAVEIRAASAAALFYGGQTLRQLLPPAIFAAAKQAGAKWELPCCKIEDKPRFGWRGLMLDSSRHFQTAADIKHWLDLLALHKFNTFHWHLVDDHGWRFESRKYPLLTRVGAWREQPPIGRYGGFYTKAEMREIVAYAAARHITVVPEIEMPGHSRAALAAYPNLACGGTKTEVDHFFDFPMGATTFPSVPGNNVFCAGKAETYQFLEDILGEVLEIFPSPYIHVGGDEVDMKYWNGCADCQAAMKTSSLANGHKLQAYLMGRMEKFLNAHGRKLIGWDEILEGGLSPNATVMSWRGTSGGIAAARSGHDAVMSPEKPLYFDHRQSRSPLHPPGFGGGVETLKEVYGYDPVPKELTAEQARHILGAQANLWTCATPDKERLELFAFPRLCALAEIAWSPAAPKDYAAFQSRLAEHRHRLDALGVNYWRDDDAFEVGPWSPNPALKDGTRFELPLERALAPGTWTVVFRYHKGADALYIDGLELLADGAVVASDTHEGIAGSQHINNQYTVAVPGLAGSAKLALWVKAHTPPWSGGGNGDTAGTVSMFRQESPRLCAALRATPGLRSTTPVTQNRDHATYDWETRHRQVLELLKTTKPDVVMIGDSITHYWGGAPAAPIIRSQEAWDRAFGKGRAANLGFGWDRTENVLWRIEHGELDGIAPKQVVLLIGINNINNGDSVADVADGIATVCVRIHEKLPDSKVLVLGVLPCRDGAAAAKAERVNFQLQTRLHPQPWINVLDVGNKFRTPDGSFNDTLFSDGLHPNAEGYGILAAELAAWLKAQ